MNCPGCGERYNGRRCHNCGYEPFEEAEKSRKISFPSRTSRKKHPLIRFLLILYLIWLLLPLLREWGLKLEAMEERNRQNSSSYHTGKTPPGWRGNSEHSVSG